MVDQVVSSHASPACTSEKSPENNDVVPLSHSIHDDLSATVLDDPNLTCINNENQTITTLSKRRSRAG